MHALLILAAVLSSQPSEPEESGEELTPAKEEPRVLLHPMLMIGLGSGGDTLSTIRFTDGSASVLKAGGLLQTGAGLIVDFTTVPFQLQAMASYLRNDIGAVAVNATVTFSRFPMEVLGFFKLDIDTVRLGGGPQYVLSPKVQLKSSEKNASTRFDDALGFVVEGGYLKCKVICLGANLRFVHQSYNAVSAVLNGQAVPPDIDKVNGNQIGGNFLIGF